MFYFLPGGLTLFGVGLVLWVQIPDNVKNVIAKYIPTGGWVSVAIFLASSYLLGHILYLLYNSTVGRMKSLRRHEIMSRYLGLTRTPNDLSDFVIEMRRSLVSAVVDENQAKDVERFLKAENMLQLYFAADKYIRLKSIDFYTLYISRLTATSRFYGVMSIGWAVLGLAFLSFFFTGKLPTGWNVVGISVLILFSYRFIRASIADQEELVWNILQATHLLNLEEQRSLKREKEIAAAKEQTSSKKKAA
ncbi:MAG: hypothetical protein QXZ09_06855 [Candidatus Methanomethylicaceae archaeon]